MEPPGRRFAAAMESAGVFIEIKYMRSTISFKPFTPSILHVVGDLRKTGIS